MRTAKTSVYLQIVDDVKRKIGLGLLREGEKLPSCRELALSLGINPNTVQRAYATLEEQGYIISQPKKGVYVSAGRKENRAEELAKEKLAELKEAGLSQEKMHALIDEIYGEKR